jgi:RNA polymerase sigma-70 factor (ECF subfamily)
VEARDLWQEVQCRLSEEERLLVELRQQGLDWASIASQRGSSPEALRKRLARAAERIARELGLGEEDHD